MKEKISILMPAYNAAMYVKQSISAILAQSYTNFELLICDDCSTDHTLDILRKISDDRVKIFENKKNKGYLVTCNELAELASGEYITFQDADDLADPHRLEILLDTLKSRQLDLVGSNVNYVSEHGDVIGRSFYPAQVDTSYLLDQLMPFCGSSILCKASVYQEIGLYDAAFDRMGAEDFDWVYRAAMQFSLGNVEQPLYSYRMHSESVSTVTSLTISSQLFSEQMAKSLFELRMKNALTVKTDAFIREQKKQWEVYLNADQTPLLMKKATINSLSGHHFHNAKILLQLFVCKAPARKKLRSICLLTLDLLLGYTRVFKLKTFYKKVFSSTDSLAV